jgi:hypothetical protein
LQWDSIPDGPTSTICLEKSLGEHASKLTLIE